MEMKKLNRLLPVLPFIFVHNPRCMKKQFLLLILCFSVSVLNAQNRKTINYYSEEGKPLQMDIFLPDETSPVKRPLFIYIHGGGFAGGDRSAGYPVCEYLARKGYVTATISYTLYMKDKSFSCDGVVSEKIRAIRYGVNDLWIATAWFIDHAGEYGIDVSRIYTGGCSAGAETVLHAAFWPYDIMNWSDVKLPSGFRYAGVISGAGALMDLNLIKNDNLIPVMMFHGNCDNLVPYATAAHHFCEPSSPGWLMFFGSYSIYRHITDMGGSAELYTYCGGGHEYSNILFEKELETVLDFMTRCGSQQKFINHRVISTGNKCDGIGVYNFCN